MPNPKSRTIKVLKDKLKEENLDTILGAQYRFNKLYQKKHNEWYNGCLKGEHDIANYEWNKINTMEKYLNIYYKRED